MNVSIPDCFMTAFAAGLIFGLVYEAIRIVRLILRFKSAVFICDVAFFILAAMLVCKLSEFLGNYVRLYTVLGFGAGVFAYIVTIGRVFNALESAASLAWRRTIGRAFRKCTGAVKKITGKVYHKIQWIFGKINEYFKNREKNRRERLHLSHKIVYNNMGNENIGAIGAIGEGEKAHVIKAQVRKSS